MVNPEKSKLEQFREAVTGWLSVVTVVIGALFGLYKYLEEQRSAQVASLRQAETLERARLAQAEKDNLTRRIEAPILVHFGVNAVLFFGFTTS